MKIPNDLDPECNDLFIAMNSLSGIKTTESCCGHAESPFRIWFHAASFADLFPLLRAVDRRYVSECYDEWTWGIESSLSDVHPFVGMVLTSRVVSSQLIYNQSKTIARDIENHKWTLELTVCDSSRQ